jgi:integrase
MEEAWQVMCIKSNHDKNTLMDFREGLVIAILSICPIRRRNITSIIIDRNLIRQSHGYILQFDQTETKTSNTLLFEIHKDLTIYLDRYVEYIRPQFPRAGTHPVLFASFKGTRLGGAQMNKRVKLLMQQEFGVGFTLHDLRRIAATTRSVHDPGNIQLAGQLLGHADPSTTDEHYILASSITASRNINRIISEKRRASAPR